MSSTGRGGRVAESIHRQICDAVAAGILGLGLEEWPSGEAITEDRIIVRWGIEKDAGKFPAIFVSPVGNVSVAPYSNERDMWSYPVTVLVVDRTSLSDHDAMDAVLLWREQIGLAFNAKRLAGVTEHCWGQFSPSPVIDANLIQGYTLLVEPVYFTFSVRQRG